MKRPDFSKKIIKILSGKSAVAITELEEKFLPFSKGEMPKGRGGQPESDPSSILPLPRGGGTQSKYALTRSIKGLEDAGLIEQVSSGQSKYARLTKEGKKKAHSQKLDGDGAIIDTSWDGYWRIIILNIPEDQKSEREALRYLLKKAGFMCIKNSVWISMLPFENLFTNIKKDLDFTTEMMIIVTDRIDDDTEKMLMMLI